MFETVSHLSKVLLNTKHYIFSQFSNFPNFGLKCHLPRVQSPVWGGGQGEDITWKGTYTWSGGHQTLLMRGTLRVGTPHNIARNKVEVDGWLSVGCAAYVVTGSILQSETCKTPSLPENPSWSRVWRKVRGNLKPTCNITETNTFILH